MNPESNALPRLLLVEDDPVSAAFLRDAATCLPAAVSVAGSVADALAVAATRAHDLYLIDANLPDGRGELLLQRLRARGDATPALAHTADRGEAIREPLLSAGFIDVLCKPLGVAELHAALRLALGTAASPGDATPAWDDAAALSALGGEQAHVDSLRALFRQELPGQRQRIEAAAAAGDDHAVRAELHRLVAGCGFVGAARVAEAVALLQAAPLDAARLQQLRAAIGASLA